MSTIVASAPAQAFTNLMDSLVAAIMQVTHVLVLNPAFLLVATLGFMLFRPPDVQLICFDRYAFALLAFAVVLRALLNHEPFLLSGAVILPLAGLCLLAFSGVLSQPYDAEAWSLFAAKWAVPFFFFYFAAPIVHDSSALRVVEVGCIVALGYLTFTAVAFLLGATSLVFPRYILDEGLGYHADRARGPFLQAVANGLSLNILALIALDCYRRHRLNRLLAILFITAVPVAIAATKTRAVWISFVASIIVALCISKHRRVRRACIILIAAGTLAIVGAAAALQFAKSNSFSERLQERSPVEFRKEIYQAGWEMFLQKPVAGWGAQAMRTELGKRISDFHQQAFFFHNTFLEITVQYGLRGTVLYLWLLLDLVRLGRAARRASTGELASDYVPFRPLWPVMLLAYFINACFVVMNYQFVNGLFFLLAGVLAHQQRLERRSRNQLTFAHSV